VKTENLRTMTLDEILALPVHPVADLFPMLPKTAGYSEGGRKAETISLTELSDNINQNGLQEPIVLFAREDDNGNPVVLLLDGRNRRAACALIKTPAKFDPDAVPVEDFIGTDEEADEYILALNVDRRDLTTGQRALTALGFWNVRGHGGDRRSDDFQSANLRFESLEAVAARFRVGTRSVEEARAQVKKVNEVQAAVEFSRQEIERQATIEAEAKAALEQAKAAGDESRVRDEAIKAQQAALVRAQEQEKLAERVDEAQKKQAAIEHVKSGQKSLNSLKTVNPGQEIKADDAVARAKERMNKIVTDLLADFADKANTILDDPECKPADREFVRQKMVRLNDFMANMNKLFGNIESVDTLVDPDENRDYWAGVEARNKK